MLARRARMADLTPFALASAGGWALVVLLAALLRSRAYAVFRAVTLGIHGLLATAIAPRFEGMWPLFVYLHATVYIQALALVRPRLRPLAYRVAVSLPAAFFSGGTLLALPWAVAAWLGLELPGVFLAYVGAGLGLYQSLRARRDVVDVTVGDGAAAESLRRHRAGDYRAPRPLSLVQITDPHLGPFMSVKRLRRICERAVERDPDLVLLTGDYLTMESQVDPALLGAALAPLQQLPGRVFACRGNHDHEAPDTVAEALRANGIRLLVDEAALVETRAGPVQVLGLDYVWRARRRHIREVCKNIPRQAGAFRLVLLHDPGAFKHLPSGDADLVLSGHTHGGQVGLVSLGLPWTLLRLLMNAPDHGLWARGTDRLYVHRGTGHYGFPLRLGVPAEESLLRVHGTSSPAAAGEFARAATSS